MWKRNLNTVNTNLIRMDNFLKMRKLSDVLSSYPQLKNRDYQKISLISNIKKVLNIPTPLITLIYY